MVDIAFDILEHGWRRPALDTSAKSAREVDQFDLFTAMDEAGDWINSTIA